MTSRCFLGVCWRTFTRLTRRMRRRMADRMTRMTQVCRLRLPVMRDSPPDIFYASVYGEPGVCRAFLRAFLIMDQDRRLLSPLLGIQKPGIARYVWHHGRMRHKGGWRWAWDNFFDVWDAGFDNVQICVFPSWRRAFYGGRSGWHALK